MNEYLQIRRDQLLRYNKDEHLELVKKFKNIKQQEKVSEVEFNEVHKKLLLNSSILIDQLHWETQDQYLNLLDQFVEEKINILDFYTAFRKRYESITDLADVLESKQVLLSPDKDSLNFGHLLYTIHGCCLLYSSDPNDFEIGEAEFRRSVKNIFFKIKKLLEK